MDFCDQLGLNYDIELNLTTPLEVKKVNIDTSNKKKSDLRDNDLAYIQSKNSYEDQEQKTKYAEYIKYNINL